MYQVRWTRTAIHCTEDRLDLWEDRTILLINKHNYLNKITFIILQIHFLFIIINHKIYYILLI